MAEAASPTATSPEFRPHVFGKFFLLQRLAVGGMAEIYRARVPGAEGFEKELVVKRILPSRAQDQGFIKMLVNEAKLTVQLTHNNIAQIYECGIIDGNYFISMELVTGVSMKEMMLAFARSGAALSPEQAIFIVLQLLQGLDYAHKRTDSQGRPLEIVHCDVSPDNALLSFEGEVKLLDFGIARAATGLSNYKEGMLMGKLGYVAPEQASLETRWDHRVDIFAAGIILYELLTQQKPFPKATDVESLIAARKTKVVPPTQIDPRLPKDIDAIVSRALAYDPGKRFSEARKFADALVDVLFPTPHSSIQELLGKQMQQVFADRIAKQRSGRAHDPLIMKVLTNAAAQQHATYQPISRGGIPATTPVPGSYAAPAPVETTASARMKAPARTRTRTVVRDGVRLSTAFLFGLVVAAAGAVALHFGEIWIRPGVVVITSDPPGAPVSFDGSPTGQVTPAVVEGVVLSRAHQVSVGGGPRRLVEIDLQPEPGRMVRRVHAKLQSTLGPVTIESEPSGAQVSFDGRPAGRTPVTIPGVRLDDRHRVDLQLAGFEIDQFVVLPEEDGARFRRRLKPVDRRRAGSQGAP
ncbi:MAG TPA: serine/threonine-protein kinase [Anaeromyxobacteraceae bacterium]|nr:serine/threonine-protein kinase [Anaeromyxobacteraceae bacterium]